MSSCHPLTRLPTGFVRQTEWNPAAKTKDKGAPQLTVSGTVASLHPSAFTRYKQSMPKQSVQNCKRRHLTKNTTNYELVFCDYCDASQKIQPIPEDSSRTQGIVGVCQTSIRCRGRSWCGKCWRTVTRKMTVWHPRRWKQGRWKTVWNSSGRSLFSDFMHDLLTCKYSCMNLNWFECESLIGYMSRPGLNPSFQFASKFPPYGSAKLGTAGVAGTRRRSSSPGLPYDALARSELSLAKARAKRERWRMLTFATGSYLSRNEGSPQRAKGHTSQLRGGQ